MTLSKHLCWAVPAGALALALPLVVFNPLGQPLGAALALMLVFGASAWSYVRQSRLKDEVVKSANRASTAMGAMIGLALALIFALAARFSPTVADLVNAAAADANSQQIGLAAIGFGLGVSFTCMLVGVSIVVAWAAWWMTKR
jgi:hypothetical protein